MPSSPRDTPGLPRPPPLTRYALISLALVLFFLALFGLVQLFEVPILTDSAPLFTRTGALGAVFGVLLLIVDVFLPVPSSLVMLAHGAGFGIFGGTALSVLGSVGAAALGFALGRRGAAWLARLISPAEKAAADRLLTHFGVLAIVVTRPVPLLAEAVAILAGASPLRTSQVLWASAAGALPPSLLYALAGASGRSTASGALIFSAVLLVAGILFWMGQRSARPHS
jgi:uncharacterized membrane protein YdjX (TVP38/TMEM64 family)